MFIDTHCHLDFKVFNGNLNKLVKKCVESGITNFINPATVRKNWNNLVKIQNEFDKIKICFGLHPLFIKKHKYSDIEDLEIYLDKYNNNLIGEIGLDKRIGLFDKQIEFFKDQLLIAQKNKSKVIIHSVRSHQEVIKIIKKINFKNGGIIHAFNNNFQIAQEYIKLNFTLGIGTLISHPKSKIRKDIDKINPKNIVLETDSPDMSLYQEQNMKRNTPDNIPKIFDILSNIYKVNNDMLMEQIYNNSLNFI